MTYTRLLAGLLALLFVGALALQSHAEDTSQPREAPGAGATAAAAVSDVFYVPGKAIVCGVSGVLWVATMAITFGTLRSEEHTSELQSQSNLVCRLLLEK